MERSSHSPGQTLLPRSHDPFSRWLPPPSPREFRENQIQSVLTSTAPARFISPNSGNSCSENMSYKSNVNTNPHEPQTTLAWRSGLRLRRVFSLVGWSCASTVWRRGSRRKTSVCFTAGYILIDKRSGVGQTTTGSLVVSPRPSTA